MKCCWRSIYGIIIGSLKILLLLGLIISLSNYVEKLNDIEAKNVKERNETVLKFVTVEIRSVIGVILVCVALIIICGLLIVGIVMRRHKLMIPWCFLSSAGLSISCLGLIGMTFSDFFSGVSLSTIALNFFKTLLGIVISVFALLPVFVLHYEIKFEEEGSIVDIEKNYKK